MTLKNFRLQNQNIGTPLKNGIFLLEIKCVCCKSRFRGTHITHSGRINFFLFLFTYFCMCVCIHMCAISNFTPCEFTVTTYTLQGKHTRKETKHTLQGKKTVHVVVIGLITYFKPYNSTSSHVDLISLERQGPY